MNCKLEFDGKKSRLTLAPKFLAILPKQMVVFVRIPGCSSFAVFARHFKSSPLITRSESFEIIVRTDFTVCSRTIGATSVKPVTSSYLAIVHDGGSILYIRVVGRSCPSQFFEISGRSLAVDYREGTPASVDRDFQIVGVSLD